MPVPRVRAAVASAVCCCFFALSCVQVQSIAPTLAVARGERVSVAFLDTGLFLRRGAQECYGRQSRTGDGCTMRNLDIKKRSRICWVRTALGAGQHNGQAKKGQKETALLSAAEEGNLEEVQRALTVGANPGCFNDWGTSCLQIAVKNGHAEVVRALLKAGANPDCASVSDDETSPLHFAAKKGLHDIAALLLASGATATKKDEFGEWPIDIARRANNKAMIQLLNAKSVSTTLVNTERSSEQEMTAPGKYRDKSYTEYGGEQMTSTAAQKLVDAAVDWDAAELGREGDDGSLVEMVTDPETGEQFVRRVPLKRGARSLFPTQPDPLGGVAPPGNDASSGTPS